MDMLPDVVAVFLLNSVSHVLLQYRHGADYANLWALPGGWREQNETWQQAACRELREETGIDCREFELLGTQQFWSRERGRWLTVLFGLGLVENPRPTLLEPTKSVDLRFFSLDDMPPDLTPTLKRFLAESSGLVRRARGLPKSSLSEERGSQLG